MKRIFTLLMVLLVVLVSVAFGADAVPVVTPAAPTVSTFQGLINWMVGNQVIVGILLAAILDFIFAINPEWKSNGALHFIYTLVQKKGQTTPPTA